MGLGWTWGCWPNLSQGKYLTRCQCSTSICTQVQKTIIWLRIYTYGSVNSPLSNCIISRDVLIINRRICFSRLYKSRYGHIIGCDQHKNIDMSRNFFSKAPTDLLQYLPNFTFDHLWCRSCCTTHKQSPSSTPGGACGLGFYGKE